MQPIKLWSRGEHSQVQLRSNFTEALSPRANFTRASLTGERFATKDDGNKRRLSTMVILNKDIDCCMQKIARAVRQEPKTRSACYSRFTDDRLENQAWTKPA